jgi:aryl-alcohol dehydrogenase-like predicted oxidoreductase
MIPKSELISNGIQLSHIAIGTHTFCRNNEKETHAILDEFVLNGGNVIDTARCYGGDVANPSHEPESESCIGSWLKTRGIRNKIILMTKGGNPEFKSGKLVKHRINEQSIETDITKSLEKLNTDYIDIYFLHKDDPNIEPAEAIEILSKYIKNGMVKHIGASNWSAERIEKANLYAQKHDLPKFEYSELAFSLKENVTNGWGKDELALEMSSGDYEYYQCNDIPVFGYGSQAYGFFYNECKTVNALDKNCEIFRRLKEISLQKRINMQQALFGFYFGCDIKNIPIISAKSISRLKEVTENCDIILDPEEVKYLLQARFDLK